MRRFDLPAALLSWMFALPAGAVEPLTVVSWGGAYEAAQNQALFEPYQEISGVDIKVGRYGGTLEALTGRAEAEGWDVVDMLEDQAIAACEAGLLLRLDHEAILGPSGELSLEVDFAPVRLRPCSVPQNVFALVIAYDDRVFPGVKPRSVEDFFDLERYPGKRAIEKSPDGILEWALMAEGVPPSQIYDLLSTDRGLRLAFRRLDAIRESIVWWEDVAAPATLLKDGRVAMASGYNGRFFLAAQDEGAPISIVWDGRLIGYDVWAIPTSVGDRRAAEAFLRFAAAPAQMARLAERIPYGPARRSALERIGLHPVSGVPMRDYLPNADHRSEPQLIRDSRWYAHTRSLRTRRFEAWLGQNDEQPEPR